MTTRNQTKYQPSKSQSQLQLIRRPSLEQQKIEPSNQILLEEIRKIRFDLRQEMTDFKAEIRQEIRTELKEINQTVEKLTNEMTLVNQKIRKLEQRTVTTEEDLAKIKQNKELELDEKALWEQKLRDRCLKIRGFPEKKGEDLMRIFTKKLAEFLEKEEKLMEIEIDRIFRLNSVVAKKRSLPRDIVIYLVRKQTRDEILKYHNDSPLTIDGKELQLFKDIPARLLKKRKDYTFLTLSLRESGIQYRWLQPEGLTFWLNKKKIIIKTTDEAKSFWELLERKKKREYKEQREKQKEKIQKEKGLDEGFREEEKEQQEVQENLSRIESYTQKTISKHLEYEQEEQEELRGATGLYSKEVLGLEFQQEDDDLLDLNQLQDQERIVIEDEEDEEEEELGLEPELEWELEKFERKS